MSGGFESYLLPECLSCFFPVCFMIITMVFLAVGQPLLAGKAGFSLRKAMQHSLYIEGNFIQASLNSENGFFILVTKS